MMFISIAFDPTNNNRMSGSESSCTLNNNKEVAQCKSGTIKSQSVMPVLTVESSF